MITDSQKQARKRFIGSSDISTICGFNKYQTTYRLWLEKTGQAEPFAGNEATYWGNALEPVVAKRLAEELGLNLRKSGKTAISKDYPFLAANADYRVVGQPIIVEIKTAGHFCKSEWGESGSDQIPPAYILQVMHQMICTGYRKAIVAVLLGGQEFRHYEIDYDQKIADFLIKNSIAFWHCVQNKIPPEPANTDDLTLMFPNDSGDFAQAGETEQTLIAELTRAKQELAKVDEQVEELQFKIKALLRDSSGFVDVDGRQLVTFKAQNSERFEVGRFKSEHPELYGQYLKNSSHRVLRIK